MKPFYRSSAILILLLLTSATPSQITAELDERCNQENSIALVTQLVEESRSVAESHKRIKILIRSAEFLWPFDEPTARVYFTDAFKVASDHFRDKGFETKKVGDDSRSALTLLPDYRFEIIAAIAKKDGNWARKLTDQMLEEFEKAAKDRNERDQLREINATLGIAVEVADRDPALSLYLFRRVMKLPLDYHWYFILYQLSAKNPSLADSLYAELLPNYRNESPRRLLFLSAYPFGNSRILGIDKFQIRDIRSRWFRIAA